MLRTSASDEREVGVGGVGGGGGARCGNHSQRGAQRRPEPRPPAPRGGGRHDPGPPGPGQCFCYQRDQANWLPGRDAPNEWWGPGTRRDLRRWKTQHLWRSWAVKRTRDCEGTRPGKTADAISTWRADGACKDHTLRSGGSDSLTWLDPNVSILTGLRAKAWCLLHTSIKASLSSLSHGGQGESLVPPYTRGSVSLSRGAGRKPDASMYTRKRPSLSPYFNTYCKDLAPL